MVTAKDPAPLFAEGPFGSKFGLDRFGTGNTDAEELRTLNEIFGLDVTVDEFNIWRTDAGAFALPPARETYLPMLQSFFESAHAHEILQHGKRWPGGHRFRRFDQRFLSFWMRVVNARSLPLPHYRAEAEHPAKFAARMGARLIPPDRTFEHYCSTRQKMWYVDILWSELERTREASS